MKKQVFMLMVAMTAGWGFAQEEVSMVESQAPAVSLSADVGVFSAYVWRGQLLNDGLVAQPSATLATGPFSVNVWANLTLDGKKGNRDNDLNEVDYTAAVALPFDPDLLAMDVGVICYTFPGTSFSSTEEAFVTSTFNSILFTPVLSAYYDLEEVDGWYGSFALSQGVEISDAMTAEIGGSVGCGTRKYNNFYFGPNNNASMNDYNVYVSANYALTEKLSLGAKLVYTVLDGCLEKDAKAIYGESETVWGGVNLSYQFL